MPNMFCFKFVGCVLELHVEGCRICIGLDCSSSIRHVAALLPAAMSSGTHQRLKTEPLPVGLVDKALPRKAQPSALPLVESANAGQPRIRTIEKRTQLIRFIKESKEYQDATAFMSSATSDSDKRKPSPHSYSPLRQEAMGKGMCLVETWTEEVLGREEQRLSRRNLLQA